ncbi:MAG TPA: alpha/beta hydrolase-fold protein [Solirubrobacteraceae bacterium]|nr:alpha/beta hydrolase-fold protein [Solirubrobacteraceae bacterium]
MTLSERDVDPGPPWTRPLAGSLDRLVVRSELLSDNPLGDPDTRPLYVYRAPGVAADGGLGGDGVPSVYWLQGFMGQVDMLTARSGMEPTFVERLDEMFAAGDCPPAIVVMVDAWTSRGGSQYLNSSSTGRYQDYLCDEIVPFVDDRYPTLAASEHRGLAGKSSGGYGAMVVPMMRPELFGALASHAGDALFECSLLPEFPRVARAMRDQFDGSWAAFRERLAQAPAFEFSRFGAAFEIYGYACCYTPDPARPGEGLIPFELGSGRLIDELWDRWLTFDPVRMADAHADALRSMRRIYLDAGTGDEWFLDLGAQAFSDVLDTLSVTHTVELFDGRHGGIGWRYPRSIRELVRALA